MEVIGCCEVERTSEKNCPLLGSLPGVKGRQSAAGSIQRTAPPFPALRRFAFIGKEVIHTMVDFHCHILPGVDDGSKSVEQSLQMLHLEQQQGVDAVILTPHFYADQTNPERFLEKREEAWQRLSAALEPGMPRFLMGAEVYYFDGMENVAQLPRLCIGDTGVLLLEMPFQPWNDRVIDTVLDMNSRSDMQVVLAHIERYFHLCRKKEYWQQLREGGVLMQVNCEFFQGFFNRKKAVKMFSQDEFQLIGSDAHNLTSRKPNWELVPPEIAQAAGSFARELLGL